MAAIYKFLIICTSALTNDLDRARGDSLSHHVEGLAAVNARILGVDAEQIEGDVVKVVSGTEAMSGPDGPAIDVPLDAHRGVVDRLQAALKVHVGAFNDVDVVQRLSEGRHLLHLHLLWAARVLAGAGGVVLQHVNLLKGGLVQRVALNALAARNLK